MRSFAMPKMAISLALAVLAACILIGINETGFNQSTRALDDIARSFAHRAGRSIGCCRTCWTPKPARAATC